MKNIAAYAVFAGAACLFWLQTKAADIPPELTPALPDAALLGQGTMAVWGFSVYQATLWVGPGFNATGYAQSPFALELTYLRDFRGADIARRSITEMRRHGPIGAEDAARWEAQMGTLFPDVKAGDRLTGMHQPGQGAVFWSNGQRLGVLADPVFAKLFFGIWLAPQTSQPALRRMLLGQLQMPKAGATAP